MTATPQTDSAEMARFEFGENWRRFAQDLGPERIEAAEASLAEWLGPTAIDGRTFLDIGAGRGLFSLAATLMGARRVHSIDYDPTSVATTESLRDRFGSHNGWIVERGSALDSDYMESLGQWDIVYAWGVLHHTGDMWRAMDLACARAKPGGLLFISIYNDQNRLSRLWMRVKRLYNILPRPLRAPYAVVVMLPMEMKSLTRHALRLQPQEYFRLWRRTGDYQRGMDRWRDLLDWVGGYPFEVATPEQVFEFCASRGFELRRLETCRGSHGCNQFVFELPIGVSGS
jgi:2-polyprenyl-3-methyl-5-hydroxy-6-metoxy-1,4-benzoquinol methylase